MKTIEEKAKAYDKALNTAREILAHTSENYLCTHLTKEDIKEMYSRFFPELAESEDDRIRKAIHIYLDWLDGRKDCQPKGDYTIKDMLAWLEKQGEQKQTDKVEPKFRVGDWIVSNEKLYVYQIEEINVFVARVNENGVSFVVDVKCLNDAHLWTIEDAKDGDVLQLGEVTAIFREYIGNEHCECYCSVCNGKFEIPSQESDDNIYGCYNVTPATKEQRELLFQKMKEAGYEWSDKNRKLSHSKVTKISDQVQKPAWSEEDEVKINRIVACLENLNVADNDILLKDVDWLKSLRPQNRWKPTKQQLSELRCVISGCSFETSVLVELEKNLKKLL